MNDAAPYGYCPRCGAPGTFRARRRNGNDRCAAGHMYPSQKALPTTSHQERLEALRLTAEETARAILALLDELEKTPRA